MLFPSMMMPLAPMMAPVAPPPPANIFESNYKEIPGLGDDLEEESTKLSAAEMALLGIDAEDITAQQL